MPKATTTRAAGTGPTRSQRAKPAGSGDTAETLDQAIESAQEETSGSGHEFATLDEAPEYQRVLWYGREGSGKTTNTATAANLAKAAGSKVLVINAEAGLKIKALATMGVDTSAVRLWPDPKNPVQVTHRRLDRLFRTLYRHYEATFGRLDRPVPAGRGVGTWSSTGHIGTADAPIYVTGAGTQTIAEVGAPPAYFYALDRQGNILPLTGGTSINVPTSALTSRAQNTNNHTDSYIDPSVISAHYRAFGIVPSGLLLPPDQQRCAPDAMDCDDE